MSYGEWEATVPGTLKADAIWRVQAYRLASYVGSEAGFDADTVAERRWLVKSAGQLASAAESVSANIAEGYARLSPKDRIRYYEYALGSAAEAKSRYGRSGRPRSAVRRSTSPASGSIPSVKKRSPIRRMS